MAIRDHIPQALNTRDIPVDRRVETWREVMVGLCCPMTCETADEREFEARVMAAELGPLGLRHMHSDPYRGRQTRQTLARSRRDLYVLTASTGGRFTMSQYGRRVELDDTSAALHSTMDELEFVHTQPSSALIVTIPADRLRHRVAIPEDFCARPLARDAPAASVFFTCLRSAAQHLDRLDETERTTLSESLIDLLALAIEGGVPAPVVPAGSVRAGHLRRVKAYVDANLHHPDLTPTSIAAATGISTRYLHDLFRHEPQTIGLWMRSERLRRARAMLADRRFSGLSISEIAYRHGFRSNAHFATSFKEAFGHTPKRWRERSGAAQPRH